MAVHCSHQSLKDDGCAAFLPWQVTRTKLWQSTAAAAAVRLAHIWGQALPVMNWEEGECLEHVGVEGYHVLHFANLKYGMQKHL